MRILYLSCHTILVWSSLLHYGNIETMYCKCGCGRLTKISNRNRKELGYIKGQPVDYLPAHRLRGRTRVFTEEWKKKISETRKRLGLAKGSNNPHWRGGLKPLFQSIRDSDKYRQWWWSVFTRDNFKCVTCRVDRGPFNINHKKPFSIIMRDEEITTLEKALACGELWDINNGETLCEKCHRQTDTYGRRLWNKYFKKTSIEASSSESSTEGGDARE